MFARYLLALIAVAAIGSPALAEAPAALTKSQVAAVRSVVASKLKQDNIPGATVAVGLGNGVIWSQGFGFADLENQVRASPDTAYRSASIGKSLTATAAMALAEKGKLALDAPIQRYCPAFPLKPWPISSRQLLNHTSGIRHYIPATEDAETYLTRHYDDAISPVEIFAADPLLFQPGKQQAYSTWGYVLLGCVIRGAAGEPYLDYMQRAIFRPAGMEATRDDDPKAIIANRARGYVLKNGKLENSRYADMSGKLSAGGFITTAPDLARFGLAFANDRLVSAASRGQMLAETRLPDGDTTNYGFGWLVNEHRGVTFASHGGGTPQVSGILVVAPERHFSIAILFNREEVGGREELALRIMDIVLALPEPKTAS